MQQKLCNNLGIMGNAFRVMPVLDSVFGYDIAVDDVFKALISHSSLEEITCICDSLQFQKSAIERKYNNLSRRGKAKTKLSIFSELDVLQYQKKANIDLLHNVSMEFIPLVFLREFFTDFKIPITYTIHGASYPNYIESFYLMKLLMPFRKYDSLICTSRAVKHVVKEMLDNISNSLNEVYNSDIKYEGRLDIIPLGVDTEKFTPRDKVAVRRECGIPEDAFVLLWVGRISAYDKADLLPALLVYKRLLEKNPDKKLLFVLAGHDRKNMPMIPQIEKYIAELGISDKVKIISQNDVSKRHLLFSTADVFVSPIDNVQETFGITPIEAMACGVPQVVSDWDGYRDTVEDGVTGFLIPTYWANCDEDIKEAALFPSEPMHRVGLHHLLLSQSVVVDLNRYENAIQTLLDNPQLCKQMSENSFRRAREKFSWQSVIKEYEKLWEELCFLRTITPEQDMSNKLRFIQPIYCKAFSRYPTYFINDSTFIHITRDGESVLEGNSPLPFHYSIENHLLEFQLAPEILKTVKDVGTKGISLAEILTIYSEKYHKSLIRRSVMWLVKQGLTDLKLS